MKPVCVPCRRFFRVKKNDFFFIEGMPRINNALPGNAEPEQWQPYKVWAADLWECNGCGAKILSGFGHEPITEHYHPDFATKIELFGATQLQVNDC